MQAPIVSLLSLPISKLYKKEKTLSTDRAVESV